MQRKSKIKNQIFFCWSLGFKSKTNTVSPSKFLTIHSSSSSSSSYGCTAQNGPWPPLMGFRNNNLFTGLDYGLWTTGRSGFDPQRGQRIFPLASVSRPALGYRGSFPGGKARPGRVADHSPPSSAEVVNE
jgi:hypothetical protein